jgi:carbon monoxide dehydrogenase subunit G
MRFQGDVTIEAPRERVWGFLSDPRLASQCAPDLQSLQIVDDGHFAIVLRTGVGPVKGTFAFAVTWLERQGPELARVRARSKVPGSAVDLETRMTLSELDGARTLLHWEADVCVRGLIASVGAGVLQGTADQTTQYLFTCVKSKLETTAPESAPA